MASVVLNGDSSGSVTLSAPSAAGTTTQTLVATSGTLAPLVAGTAVASTSGTSIDFTSIPSWVKRITVMFNGVSTNGSSNVLVQIGSGSFTTTGYVAYSAYTGATNAAGGASVTSGMFIYLGAADAARSGHMVFTNVSGNVWVSSHTTAASTAGNVYLCSGGGDVTLSGTLDRIRITTVNGTDTFDAGSINILYE